MNSKKVKSKLHSIALKYNIRDEVAKLIVESPILFMKNTIEQLDLDKLEDTNFYHRYFGRFYLKEKVLKHIKNKIKQKEEDGKN